VQGNFRFAAPQAGIFYHARRTSENKKVAKMPCNQDLLTTGVFKIKTPALYQY